MSQNKTAMIAGLALALFSTIWLARSPFHSEASENIPKKSSRTRFVKLAPGQMGDAIARRDDTKTILPVSNPQMTPLRQMMARHAAMMEKSDLGSQAEAIESELNQFATRLSADDIAELGLTLQDERESQNKRALSVYLLSRAGAHGIGALSKLAMTNAPTKLSEERETFEISLRVTALRALDALSGTETMKVAESMRRVIERQQNPTLKMMAKVSLDGIEASKPQRLGRAMEQVLPYAN